MPTRAAIAAAEKKRVQQRIGEAPAPAEPEPESATAKHKPVPRPGLRYSDSQRQQCINALAEADHTGVEIDFERLARRIGKDETDARAIVALGYRNKGP